MIELVLFRLMCSTIVLTLLFPAVAAALRVFRPTSAAVYRFAWGSVFLVSLLTSTVSLRFQVAEPISRRITASASCSARGSSSFTEAVKTQNSNDETPRQEKMETGSQLPQFVAENIPTVVAALEPVEIETVPQSPVEPVYRPDNSTFLFLTLFLFWGIGIVFFVGRRLVLSVKMHRFLVSRSILELENEAEIRSLWRRVLSEYGLAEMKIPLVISDTFGPAMVLHGFRPHLYLPRNVCEELPESLLEGVFRHEAAHCLYRDPYVTPLVWCCAVALWFHPLAWKTLRNYELAVEWSCDERAYLGTDRIDPECPGSALLAETFLLLHDSMESLRLNISTFARFSTLDRVDRLVRSETYGKESMMKKVCLIALLGLVFFCGLVRVRIVAKENLRDLTPENAVHSVGDVEGSALAYASRSDSDSANDGAEKLRLMYDEIRNGLTQRHLNDRYAAYRNYSAKILDESYRYQTGSEINGRWTLSWYDYLFRNPLDSVFELERFTRTIHDGLNGDANDLTTTLTRMREKLDVASRTDGGIRFSKTESPEQAVEKIKQALAEARRYHNKAVATLSSGEIQKLKQDLYPTFSSENGHTIKSRSYARELCSLLLKIDRGSMHNAAESLLPLTDRELLSQLASLPEDAYPVSLMDGNKVQRISTPNGDIIIGGREDNVYRLDAMKNVICVIDLGGNDTYIEGTCDLDRPVFVIIDLEGDDTYRGTKPGIQGSSILGVSMLLDLAGDDTYRAEDLAQGATLGGVGILIDYSGNDQYTAKRRAQGSALGGIGMLIDKSGSDRYRAALWAQGFGHPGGFGVLEDSEGDDTYYLGGLYRSSYPEHPGYDAWGQGVGAGIRQVANGGIGLLLDGHGDDTYEFDYFAHGGGYWFGVGAARDFSGNDQRLGSTREAFEGGTRTEAPWQQYGNGFACHYALGFLFDDEGDDLYAGTTQGSGHAHDLSTAFLCDFAGNDIFSATGGLAQGCAAQAGIGVLFNYGGNDVYEGHSQGSASTNISFHDPNECGGNFSFLIDYGGDDRYGCGASNNSYNLRASESGFLIDRPLDPEIDE